MRIAAGSPSQIPRPVAWGVTGVLIFVAGLLMWGTRGSLASSLDRWLTLPTWEIAEPTPEIVPPPVIEEVEVEPEDTGPIWTFETIEAAIVPLPDQLQALSTAGGSEQADFADLARRDAPEALQRSRWDNWRQIWRNRTLVLRQTMPPLEECRSHAALEATCQVVDTSLRELESIANLEQASDAPDVFQRADEVLETWRLAKEAEEQAALEAEALAAEALAAEALEAQALTDEILDGTEEPLPDAQEDVEVEDLLDPNG